MYLDLYRGADPEGAFDHFKENARSTWSPCGRSRAPRADRRAHYKAAGEITLLQMLHEWAMHDLITSDRSPNSFVLASTGSRPVRWAKTTS